MRRSICIYFCMVKSKGFLVIPIAWRLPLCLLDCRAVKPLAGDFGGGLISDITRSMHYHKACGQYSGWCDQWKKGLDGSFLSLRLFWDWSGGNVWNASILVHDKKHFFKPWHWTGSVMSFCKAYWKWMDWETVLVRFIPMFPGWW